MGDIIVSEGLVVFAVFITVIASLVLAIRYIAKQIDEEDKRRRPSRPNPPTKSTKPAIESSTISQRPHNAKLTIGVVILTLGTMAFIGSFMTAGGGTIEGGLVAAFLNPLFFVGIPLGIYLVRAGKKMNNPNLMQCPDCDAESPDSRRLVPVVEGRYGTSSQPAHPGRHSRPYGE